MQLITSVFRLPDAKKDSLRIALRENFTAAVAAEVREIISRNSQTDQYHSIYLDASAIEEADLSAINEIIHSHYTLSGSPLELVLVYKKSSAMEKWVQATGLGKFVSTAILPS